MDASARAGLVLGVVAGAATLGASGSSSSSDDSSELLNDIMSLSSHEGLSSGGDRLLVSDLLGDGSGDLSSVLHDSSEVGRLDGNIASSLGGVVDRSIDLVAHSSMLLANPGGFAPSISSS